MTASSRFRVGDSVRYKGRTGCVVDAVEYVLDEDRLDGPIGGLAVRVDVLFFYRVRFPELELTKDEVEESDLSATEKAK